MTKTLSLLVAAIALGLSAGNSLAAVSAEQASALKNQLTPLGAEKAGNAAGSIPVWSGGLTKAPAVTTPIPSRRKNRCSPSARPTWPSTRLT